MAASEVDRLKGPARRLQEAATAEADAQAALDQIAADEAAEMSAWAETGEGEPPAPHTAGRRKAAEALARAKATANAARSAGADLQERLSEASRRHAALTNTAREHIASVLLEEATIVANEIEVLIARATGLATRYAAASELLHQQQHDAGTYAIAAAARERQPRLLLQLLEGTSNRDVDAAKTQWQFLAHQLQTDANATVRGRGLA